MLIELPTVWVVVLNVAGWPVIQLALAWIFTSLPTGWFVAPRPYQWERGGRFYETVFAIKSWKDRLPDASGWFRAGFAKANLASHTPDYLRRFIAETWRGELCHWAALGFAPAFFLWNPWWADLVMLAYAIVANIPCILAQRYNRARLQRLLARQSPRTTSAASQPRE